VTFLLTPYAVAQFIAAALSAIVAVLAWRRRRIPGGGALTLMMCAVVIWTLMSAFESGSVGLRWKLLFSQLAYAGTVNVAPLFLLFVLRYRDRSVRLHPLLMAALFALPAATLALAFTNPLHGLVWPRIDMDTTSGLNVAIYSHGIAYWVALAYYLMLCLAGAIILVRAVLRSPGLYRSQTVVLLTAVAVPWIGALAYLLPIHMFPGLDLVSMAFAVSGVLLVLGMTRYRLFDLVPVARDVLVGRMADGLLVLDSADRIVDANPSALALLGIGMESIGMKAGDALGALAEPLARQAAGGESRIEAVLPGPSERHIELGASLLKDRWGRPAGRLIVARDVTDKRRAELEREKLIGDLQAALADIKTLRGLLPICASCKKIRDDGGYWQHLEQYVSAHSEAHFSHSLCPDCITRLYPELAGRMPGQGERAP